MHICIYNIYIHIYTYIYVDPIAPCDLHVGIATAFIVPTYVCSYTTYMYIDISTPLPPVIYRLVSPLPSSWAASLPTPDISVLSHTPIYMCIYDILVCIYVYMTYEYVYI